MTEFICPNCGRQKGDEFKGFIICPSCKNTLALGGIIITQEQKLKYLEDEKKDLSDKLIGCKNPELDKVIIDKMKKNKEELDNLKNQL